MEKARRRITIVLEPKNGLIPLPSFKTAIEQLAILVNEVASEISETKTRRISWGIAQLSMNSPATVSIESSEEEAYEIAYQTVSTVIKGLAKLQKEHIRPHGFNDSALESAQKLARLTTDGLTSVNIYANIPDHQTYVNEQIAANITTILEYLDYYGSVEGKLELISGREGQPVYFRVQDRINNVSVRCIIPDNLVETALNAFRKRIIVSGTIKSDNNGIPRSIKADNIEVVFEADLPQAEDIIKELEEQTFKIQPYGNES